MAARRGWVAAWLALSVLGAACGAADAEQPITGTTPLSNDTPVGAPASTAVSTTAQPAPTTTASTQPPTTVTSLGVQPDGTLLGPGGLAIDLRQCPEEWGDGAGVTADAISIGTSAPLSGPYAVFSTIQDGMRARLDAANQAGGIGGRRVELTVLDDGWDPTTTGANAVALSDQGVLALAGIFGTNQNIAAAAVTEPRCIPLLAVSASAGFGDPTARPWSIGTAGSWPAEMLITIQQIALAQPAGAKVLLVVDDEPELTPELIRAAQSATAKVPGTELLPAVYLPRDGSGTDTALAQITAAAPTAIIVAANERGATPIITAISATTIAVDQRWTASGTMGALTAAHASGWRLVRPADAPTSAATTFEGDFLTAADNLQPAN
ncbi:MAG: ABC transporter substrate-binding protein, partial [Acidimicrobiia bacterium]